MLKKSFYTACIIGLIAINAYAGETPPATLEQPKIDLTDCNVARRFLLTAANNAIACNICVMIP
jgi:hypothetical protein